MCYGKNVVGVPQFLAQAPLLFELLARPPIQLALVLAQRFGIQPALRADSMIACEHLFAQIARVSAQLPLVDAIRAAKCEAAFWNFNAAPPAESALA